MILYEPTRTLLLLCVPRSRHPREMQSALPMREKQALCNSIQCCWLPCTACCKPMVSGLSVRPRDGFDFNKQIEEKEKTEAARCNQHHKDLLREKDSR